MDLPIVVTEPVRQRLDPRPLEDYTEYKTDMFYRWKWDRDGRYTTEITPGDADEWIDSLVFSNEEYSDTHLDICQKSLKRVFKFHNHRRGRNFEWDPEYSFNQQPTAPRDYLTMEERKAVREAALELGSVPSYNALSPEERDRWKAVLAQRFEKPKSLVARADWERANGWKIPSIVWTSLDTGLRPIEVGRATIQWLDIDNKVLRIPKDESSKNRENWTVAISDRTAEALGRWVEERAADTLYDDRDALWLTKYGNPYGSSSLRRLLHRLCDVADIDYENRQMSWYSIRHSVGTYMTREEDLAAAQAQLRHKSPKTTMKYDQAPVEDRRSALNKMG